MRSRYHVYLPEGTYFITSTVIDWLCIFGHEDFPILTDALLYARKNKGLKLYAYVLLPNHFHLIVSGSSWPKTIKEFKSFTARTIIKKLQQCDHKDFLEKLKDGKKDHKPQSTYQVWQEGFHPQLITSSEMFCQKLEYMHYNPVKHGYVSTPEEWKHSSYQHYAHGRGILDIDEWDG